MRQAAFYSRVITVDQQPACPSSVILYAPTTLNDGTARLAGHRLHGLTPPTPVTTLRARPLPHLSHRRPPPPSRSPSTSTLHRDVFAPWSHLLFVSGAVRWWCGVERLATERHRLISVDRVNRMGGWRLISARCQVIDCGVSWRRCSSERGKQLNWVTICVDCGQI